MTRCRRCGTDRSVETLVLRVNDTAELLRTPLCDPCRDVFYTAIAQALTPVGRAAAA